MTGPAVGLLDPRGDATAGRDLILQRRVARAQMYVAVAHAAVATCLGLGSLQVLPFQRTPPPNRILALVNPETPHSGPWATRIAFRSRTTERRTSVRTAWRIRKRPMRHATLLACLLALAPAAGAQALQAAVFAGGCFWGVEGVFEHVRGVRSATSGYAGGHAPAPTYRQVTSGTTGHAEAVRVVFDPEEVSYAQLLQVFFTVAHDPTQVNRQGPDVGTQYRSAVFYAGEAQRRGVEAFIASMDAAGVLDRPIATEVRPLDAFYEAEEYHQDYMERHPYQPYIVIHDAPKVRRLRAEFPRLYRDRSGE